MCLALVSISAYEKKEASRTDKCKWREKDDKAGRASENERNNKMNKRAAIRLFTIEMKD